MLGACLNLIGRARALKRCKKRAIAFYYLNSVRYLHDEVVILHAENVAFSVI